MYEIVGAAEVIMFGLGDDVVGKILNLCGERIKGGESLPLGDAVSGIVDGYPVVFRSVSAHESYREHVGYALWFYGGAPFPLVQLLWPDNAGRFPGDMNANPSFTMLQPLLP